MVLPKRCDGIILYLLVLQVNVHMDMQLDTISDGRIRDIGLLVETNPSNSASTSEPLAGLGGPVNGRGMAG